MILEQRQARKFYKLIDSFTLYTAKELGIAGPNVRSATRLSEDDYDAVHKRVWGKGGDLSLIDAYVHKNPDRLGRADLREIESWKSGIYQTFRVQRVDRDVLFLLGERAFAVRGLDAEVDSLFDSLPCVTNAALLPFGGLITYGTVVTVSDRRVSNEVADVTYLYALDLVKSGLVAKTARDFVAVSALAVEEEERLDAEQGLDQGELVTTHKGALAGLSWEERTKARNEAERGQQISDAMRSMLMRQIDATCDADVSDAEREEALANLEVRNSLDSVVADGAEAVRFLRRAWDAGGELRFPEGGITHVADVPLPVFPITSLRHEGQEYIFSIPSVVYDALANVDWDAELDSAEQVDRMIRCLRHAIQLYGIMTREDALACVLKQCGAAQNEEAFVRAVVLRPMSGVEAFESVHLDGENYYVDIDLATQMDTDDEGTPYNPRAAYAVLDSRAKYPRRPLEDMAEYTDVYECIEQRDSYRKLVAYLDEHVPEGKDDYVYADNEAFLATIAFFGEDNVRGYAETPEEIALYEALNRDVPKWRLHGWSLNEVEYM